MERWTARTALAAVALALLAGGAAAQSYTITDLGTPPGYATSYGCGLNSLGQVAGYASSPGRAVLWSSGAMLDLGVLPGQTVSYARGVNDSGQVVGYCQGSGNHAFLWQTGRLVDISVPRYSTLAYAINSAGQVAEVVSTSQGSRPVVYANGKWTYLPGLTAKGLGGALTINDSGVAAGYAYDKAGTRIAAVWTNGRVTPLPLLPGTTYSDAWSINVNGDMTGRCRTGAGDRMVLWFRDPQTGGYRVVDTGLPGIGFGINDLGHAVGTDQVTNTVYLVDAGGTRVTDLNTMTPADSEWRLALVFAINGSGQITGYGQANGVVHALLLTPQPATP